MSEYDECATDCRCNEIKTKIRICDWCEEELETTEFHFSNGKKTWSRFWCNDCLTQWKCTNIDLLNSLKEIVVNKKITLWQKIKNKLKRKNKG